MMVFVAQVPVMAALVVLFLAQTSNAFQASLLVGRPCFSRRSRGLTTVATPSLKHGCHSQIDYCPPQRRTSLSLSQSQDDQEYSREIRLREEAESPFRKVRFFVYLSLGGGAATSLVLSLARIAAALNGVNEDLLQESVVNAVVDLVGIVILAILWQRDVTAQDSRLKRAAKGAALAKLNIRGSTALLGTGDDTLMSTKNNMVTTSLSSLRRGRGIDKRVVITLAGKDKIQQVLKEVEDDSLQDALLMNDLVVVPVVMPQGIAPLLSEDVNAMPECVALPVGNNWKTVVDDEASEAREQGVDVENEGICIVLKKNGRVGQRTRGIFLGRMVGEVEDRRELGMDVSNI